MAKRSNATQSPAKGNPMFAQQANRPSASQNG